MRVPHYLTREPFGFCFRILVPQCLRHTLGRKVIRRSLRTCDLPTAQAWALVLAHRYRLAFRQMEIGGGFMRGGDWDDDEIEEIGRVVPDTPEERERKRLKKARAWLDGIHRKTAGEQMAEAFGLDEQGNDQTYTLRIDPTTGRPVEMSSADADDHARMLEALKAAGAAGAVSVPAKAVAAVAEEIARDKALPEGITAKPLGKAVDEYLARVASEATTPAKEKTHGRRVRWLSGFVEHAKRKTSVHEIKRHHCSTYADTHIREGLNKSTVADGMGIVAAFFDWAQSSGYYPEGDNPARKQVKRTRKDKQASAARGWEAFDEAQLRKIFDPERFAELKTDADRWLPLLALYTGARSNELAMFELRDIYQDRASNAWVFDINDLGEYKSTKTEASKRKVPIHPDLIALGLLERVETLKAAGETLLFPGLSFDAQNGPANAPQRAFLRRLEAWKITARYGKVGLHSFRDTVIQAMEDAGVSQGWRERYVGHEASEQTNTLNTAHTQSYGKTPMEQVAAHCHPALCWAEQGVINVAALRLLLVGGSTNRRRKKAPAQADDTNA
ncbi:MAG: site-specific integrase [Pseudoxanthomonas sp.]